MKRSDICIFSLSIILSLVRDKFISVQINHYFRIKRYLHRPQHK
ncbi:hypothetical protein HMPREF9151_02117 [Hoylesella saccharolytica F0055]|uniref:Uncharacterized protein n=1 Tax=Hoylesella saccharolytica F0055 TaxID=1127699 RepID=L1N2N5_9BACT|nr:hypothetical protein HMPREF9151_02117 [Hoylesella saccharolytica F0055]